MTLNVEVLEQSFELIKPQAPEFVTLFYDTLFTDYPQTRAMFAYTNMAHQKQMLGGALGLVISYLRQPAVLTDVLHGLGAKHQGYGVQPEQYALVGAALLKTLAITLGPAWTTETRLAWTDAYGAITSLMLEGTLQPA